METQNNSKVKPQAATSEEPEREEPGKGAVAGEDTRGPFAPPAPELPADLAAAYRKLREEKEGLYDRLLRKQAELENFRKRLQREKEDFLQHATGDVIRALLPVLDGFERALKHREADVPEKFYQGMELIYRDLLEVLGRAGLTSIETAGKLFDPHLHQAVETLEAPGHRDQEIVEELQRGYRLKHRLLRPAIVKVAVVSQGKTSKAQPEESGQDAEPAESAPSD